MAYWLAGGWMGGFMASGFAGGSWLIRDGYHQFMF